MFKSCQSGIVVLLMMLVVFFSTCKSDDDMGGGVTTSSDLPNILLIIADDMGKDATAGYTEGSTKPNTPYINDIREEGLKFNNFWVNPTCSPTRAAMITGKYGYHTGVKWAGDELGVSENILHKYISEETNGAYSSAIIGKWHLSGDDADINPEVFGIDYYAGLMRGGVQDYYRWQLTENGNASLSTSYITETFTDLSIDWVNSQNKPWFLWLAYNAPHTPFHAPPVEMHSQGDLPAYAEGMDEEPYYMAAIEAMDYQIGELLNNIPQEELDNTVIIFIGDNGTPNQVVQAPYISDKAKGSLYQGGINVPLFIKGKGVSRTGEDNSLICNTDMFSTIANLAGISESSVHDSKSFVNLLNSESSHRDFQYTEMNDGTRDKWTISNGSYKLIVSANGNEEMYDLSEDPYENVNLLNGTLSLMEENVKADLELALLDIRN